MQKDVDATPSVGSRVDWSDPRLQMATTSSASAAARTFAPSRTQKDVDATPSVGSRVDWSDPMKVPLEIAFEDAHFVVVNKPVDVRMMGEFALTMEKLLPLRCALPPAGRFWHCHQLDYATSGALLYAKSSEAAAAAILAFSERQTHKRYLALLQGHLRTVPHAIEGISECGPLIEDFDGEDAAHVENGVSLRALKEAASHATVPTGSYSGSGPSPRGELQLTADEQKQLRVTLPSQFYDRFRKTVAELHKTAACEPAVAAQVAATSWSHLKAIGRSAESAAASTAASAAPAASTAPTTVATAALSDPSFIALLQPDRWQLLVLHTCIAASGEDKARLTEEALAHKRKAQEEQSAAAPFVRTASTDLPCFLVDLPITDIAADDWRMALYSPSAPPLPSTPVSASAASASASAEAAEGGKLEGPRPALTHVTVLAYGSLKGKPVTKVLFTPITGRRHQLRLHAMACGHPIVGDATYGSDSETARMCLHAWRLRLNFAWMKALPKRAFKSVHRFREEREASASALAPLQACTPDPFVEGAADMDGLSLEPAPETEAQR
jgi:23S rRNA-/tRNA-specific pseudouridylate synthase